MKTVSDSMFSFSALPKDVPFYKRIHSGDESAVPISKQNEKSQEMV